MIRRNKRCFVYLRKLVIHRREMRYIRIEIMIYLMRFLLLSAKLRITGFHEFQDPIFTSLCAVIMAIFVIFKQMRSKKAYYKLEIEDIKMPEANSIPNFKNDKKNQNTVILTDAQISNMTGQNELQKSYNAYKGR